MGFFGLFGSSLTPPPSDKDTKIVIIGASYAGKDVAKQLAEKIKSQIKSSDSPWTRVKIRLIEKGESFHHAMASPRAIVDEKVAKQTWVPLDRVFGQGADPKQFTLSLNTTVKSITDNHVETISGEQIPFDYLVIATGSANRAPMKLQQLSTEAAFKVQQSVVNAISKAKSVLIIGGGAVAIETAGEIVDHHPNVKVFLYEQGPRLLNGQTPAVSDKFSQTVKERLEAKGVEVHLGEGIDIPAEIWNDDSWIGLENKTFTTKSGKEVNTDVQLILTGNAKFNSDIVSGLSGVLDEKTKEILITPTYQLPGHPNIFALGDVAKTGMSKQGVQLRTQVPQVVDNLLKLIGGDANAKLSTLDVSKPTSLIALTIGKSDGLGEFGPLGAQTGWFGRKIVGSFKSDMMIGHAWKDSGYPKPL